MIRPSILYQPGLPTRAAEKFRAATDFLTLCFVFIDIPALFRRFCTENPVVPKHSVSPGQAGGRGPAGIAHSRGGCGLRGRGATLRSIQLRLFDSQLLDFLLAAARAGYTLAL